MSVSSSPQFNAGWYDNTNDPGTQRYWDGENWTDNYVKKDATPVKGEGEMATGLVVVSYVLAALMPLIGFILGLVVVTRPVKATSKHGIWIIVLSIVAFIAWIAIIASSTTTTTYTTY
jgi:uncharacterized membrane protein YhaH (DUF805 family)